MYISTFRFRCEQVRRIQCFHAFIFRGVILLLLRQVDSVPHFCLNVRRGLRSCDTDHCIRKSHGTVFPRRLRICSTPSLRGWRNGIRTYIFVGSDPARTNASRADPLPLPSPLALTPCVRCTARAWFSRPSHLLRFCLSRS